MDTSCTFGTGEGMRAGKYRLNEGKVYGNVALEKSGSGPKNKCRVVELTSDLGAPNTRPIFSVLRSVRSSSLYLSIKISFVRFGETHSYYIRGGGLKVIQNACR